jgi:hypothetical protein
MADTLDVQMLPLADLHPDPRNPRNNTGAIEMIASSIRQFGFKVPLVVNADRLILAGHARYLAAQMLHLTEVPCVLADDLTVEQQRGFSIAENRTSDFSFFDIAKLAEMSTELPEELVADFDLASLLGSVDDPQLQLVAPAVPEKREGLDLAPFEKYQYVTIVCRNTYDYSNLLDRLGLEDIQARYVGGFLKRGSSTGRVMEYAEFLRRVGP